MYFQLHQYERVCVEDVYKLCAMCANISRSTSVGFYTDHRSDLSLANPLLFDLHWRMRHQPILIFLSSTPPSLLTLSNRANVISETVGPLLALLRPSTAMVRTGTRVNSGHLSHRQAPVR